VAIRVVSDVDTRTAVDVVVVSYNSRETLRDCVGSLAGTPGVRVTVVDNGSTDGSLESLAGLPVHTIVSGRNGGFGFGCNIGWRAGRAPYVLFLNPDARLEPAALATLGAVLDRDAGVGIVGPRILDADGSLVPSQRRYQRVGSTWAQALFLHRVIRRARWANEIIKDPGRYGDPADAEWLSGACLLMRRTVLDALGGFDEDFFLYCEDMDLCARARAAGARVRYEPGAVVHHEGGHSAPRTSLFAVLARSRMRYATKHGGRCSAALQHWGLAVGAVTHTLVAVGRPAHARGHRAALAAIVAPEPAARTSGEELHALG
jgi:N-acetylglucosaminyl-diphospho-decaprenol L-rhamnosyltransferase